MLLVQPNLGGARRLSPMSTQGKGLNGNLTREEKRRILLRRVAERTWGMGPEARAS
jgi:hypothetical protein